MEHGSDTSEQPFTGEGGRLSFLSSLALAATFFLVPLIPDFRIARPKLLVLEAGLFTALILWLAGSLLRSRMPVRRIMVFGPMAAYVTGTLIFYAYAPDRILASSELNRILLAILAYMTASFLVSSPRERALIFGGWLGGTVLAVAYGLLQHTGGVGILIVPHLDRISSTFGNPIFFGSHLVVTILLGLGAWFATRRVFPRIMLGAVIAGAVYALYLTQSRAAYVGLAVAVLVFALMGLRRPETRVTFVLVFLIIVAGGALAIRPILLREQFHLLIWRDALSLWLAHPWSGAGLGGFAVSFPQVASPELRNIWPQGQFIVNDAHNEYIQVLAETGIAGLGLFLWLLIAFFRNAFALAARAGRERWVIYGCAAAAAGILAQNVFSVDLRFTVSTVSLFFVMGLVNSFVEEGVVMENFTPVTRVAGIAALCCASVAVFPRIARPYFAQQKVAALPDFFDEKILEPARTTAELEALARKYPDQTLVFEKLAWVYAKEKNWPQAIKNYESAVQHNPRAAGALNNLGNIYFLLGDQLKAIDTWARSLDINPNQVDSRLNLATAYYYQGKLKEASQQLEEVLRLDPANEKAIVMLKQIRE